MNEKTFWKIMIIGSTIMLALIIYEKSYRIQLHRKAEKKLDAFKYSTKQDYNDGVSIGWSAACLEIAIRLEKQDKDYTIPLHVHRDTTLYKKFKR